MSIVSRFWERYIKADEIKRREMILELTGINNLNVSLIQSYFDDIIDYFEEKSK